jgi:hypothetical protein
MATGTIVLAVVLVGLSTIATVASLVIGIPLLILKRRQRQEIAP